MIYVPQLRICHCCRVSGWLAMVTQHGVRKWGSRGASFHWFIIIANDALVEKVEKTSMIWTETLKYLYFDLMFWNAKISKNPEWPDLFCRVPFGGSLWISSRINSFHGALCILIGCLVANFCRYRLGRSPRWFIESPCVLFDLDFLEVTASEGYQIWPSPNWFWSHGPKKSAWLQLGLGGCLSKGGQCAKGSFYGCINMWAVLNIPVHGVFRGLPYHTLPGLFMLFGIRDTLVLFVDGQFPWDGEVSTELVNIG